MPLLHTIGVQKKPIAARNCRILTRSFNPQAGTALILRLALTNPLLNKHDFVRCGACNANLAQISLGSPGPCPPTSHGAASAQVASGLACARSKQRLQGSGVL